MSHVNGIWRPVNFCHLRPLQSVTRTFNKRKCINHIARSSVTPRLSGGTDGLFEIELSCHVFLIREYRCTPPCLVNPLPPQASGWWGNNLSPGVQGHPRNWSSTSLGSLYFCTFCMKYTTVYFMPLVWSGFQSCGTIWVLITTSNIYTYATGKYIKTAFLCKYGCSVRDETIFVSNKYDLNDNKYLFRRNIFYLKTSYSRSGNRTIVRT